MKTIRVQNDLRSAFEEFISKNGVRLKVITKGQGIVNIVKSSERLECDKSTLRTGGWITCETALAVAAKLDIEPIQAGNMMDHLDIKIRRCGLGCFE
jgi:hypothetical protein